MDAFNSDLAFQLPIGGQLHRAHAPLAQFPFNHIAGSKVNQRQVEVAYLTHVGDGRVNSTGVCAGIFQALLLLGRRFSLTCKGAVVAQAIRDLRIVGHCSRALDLDRFPAGRAFPLPSRQKQRQGHPCITFRALKEKSVAQGVGVLGIVGHGGW